MSENRGGVPRNRKPVPVSGGNADKARQGTSFSILIIERDTLEHSQKYIERHRKCSIRVYLLIAMFTRSRKADNSMKNYYIVIGAFVGVCVLSVLYVLLNPKKSFAQMPVIDDTAILVHNGQQGSAFQRGENQFFQVIYYYRRVIPCCVGLEFS